MCERCDEGTERLLPLDAHDRQDLRCEWSEEEDEAAGLCGAQAAFALESWYVESHACEEHMQTYQAELRAGLGEFLEQAGFGQTLQFEPIAAAETCDGDVASGECSRRATHAKFVLDTIYLCEEHARDEGA